MGKIKRNILRLLLVITVPAMMLIIFETILGFVIPNHSNNLKHTILYNDGSIKIDDHWLIDNEKLILSYPTSSSVNHKLKFKDEIIFDVRYSSNKFGIRQTKDLIEGKKSFAIFFGGSFAYGHGVNDDETVPFYFSSKSPRYKAYNYGFSGTGPNYMLRQIEKRDLLNEVKEKDGIIIYYLIEDHLNRVVLTSDNLSFQNRPYYKYQDKNMVYKGSFNSIDSFYKKGLELYAKTNFYTFFNLRFPVFTSENTIELACQVIKESKRKLSALYQNSKFVVYYEEFRNKTNQKSLTSCLSHNKIETLQKNLIFLEEQRAGLNYRYDGHPTPLQNRLISNQLIDYINSI